MVSKRRFNQIKKKNPESRIWQRDWETQEMRNELYKAIMEAKRNWMVHPYVDAYRKQLELNHETARKWEKIKNLERKLDDKERELYSKNKELKHKDNELSLLSFQNSVMAEEIQKSKWEQYDSMQNLWLLSFREFPWWKEKTWEQQMDNFVSLLKFEKLLSVEESEDFYDISISLPYWVYKLHCTKKIFDLNCARENPKWDYAIITKLDWDLKWRWLYRIAEKDAIKLSEDLLFLFDKLWKNNLYKESMDYFKRINWRVSSSVKEDDFWRIWSFFGMFISSVLKDSTWIKTSWVWFSNFNNIDNRNCISSAGSVCSNCGGSLEHDLHFGYKSTGNFEWCRALYIEK